METGKTGKYFKYAIGEIILVVIGILIALQINNWNENRKDRIEERYVLMQLETEFESNLEQLDEKIAIRKQTINASLKLLEYTDNPSLRNNDSITKYIANTLDAPTFDPIINDLISSGKLQLLQNNRLKQLLSFWTSEIIQVTEDETNWSNVMLENYTPFLKKHCSYRNLMANYWKTNQVKPLLIDKDQEIELDLTDSKRLDDISTILDVPDFENHIADCATWNKLVNIQSETLRKRIAEILRLIHQQLEDNQ
jgi:hypothetical protein